MQAATPKTNDIEAIRGLLTSLIAEGHADEAVEAALAMLGQLRTQNSELMLKLLALQRERSGRRTEKLDPAQLSLLLELCGEEVEGEADEAEDEPEDEGLDEAPVRRKPRRRRPTRELPRDVISHELPAAERTCTGCGGEMRHIGDDVSELFELVPAHFRVQEHRRAKYACPRCKETVKTAPGQNKLVEKGLAGTGLLAHVVLSKYEDAVPLHRLCKIYARGGVDLSVSTLCDWVAAVAEEVRPLVGRIEEQTWVAHVLQGDGSGLKVLDPAHPEHIRKGTMWCYVGDRKNVVFKYAPMGSGEDGPWKHLAGRKGYVQADASNVFDRLFNGQRAEATEVGCWAHARRKLYALLDSDPRVAYPMDLIGKLYRVEHLADRLELSPEERVKLRHERSTSILERLHRWLVKTAAKEPPESALHKACAYSVNHWQALTRLLEDGRLTLDNNFCELQIRTLAIGRKNFLFAGSDAGAERAAILYTLLRTAALHKIDTYAYLIDVLDKLAAAWPQRRLDELLPENWAVARRAQTADAVAAL